MNKKYLKKNKDSKVLTKTKGFTIIETMIAITVFLVLIMGGMVTLVNAFVIHKKSQNIRSEMDNLSFIMEDISRNLRTGSQYYCIVEGDNLANVNQRKSSPPFGATKQECVGIAFNPPGGSGASNTQWIYYVDVGNNRLFKSKGGNTNFIQLTPDNVRVEKNAFIVWGAEAPPGDTQQPIVLIKLRGSITIVDKGVVSPFSLETMVSQRLLDI